MLSPVTVFDLLGQLICVPNTSGCTGKSRSSTLRALETPKGITLRKLAIETILHIGQHKTGTTSLQSFLQGQAAELRAQGCYYPTSLLGHSHASHYLLNVYALAEERSSTMKDHLLATRGAAYLREIEVNLPAEIARIYREARQAQCHRVIWSNEGLYLLNSVAEYQKLRDLLAPHSSKITVMCCFREREAYRTSYAQQLQLQGISFSERPDSYRYVEPDSWLVDYDRKKQLLGEVFQHAQYWDYDPKDNIHPFLNVLQIELKASTQLRLNASEGGKPGLWEKVKRYVPTQRNPRFGFLTNSKKSK